MQAAQQQIEEMGQAMEQMHQMLKSVQNSIEVQELRIKEYDAETKRISATQAGMTPEQIQDIAMGTIDAAMEFGDISGGTPQPAEQPI